MFVVSKNVQVDLLIEYHERIRVFVFLNPQDQHPLYLSFELLCAVPVAAPVWKARVTVIFVSFIGATLFIACSFVILIPPDAASLLMFLCSQSRFNFFKCFIVINSFL